MKKEINTQILDKEKIDELIKNTYTDGDIIFDGIINEEEYFKSSVRILWILWEPYDDGGWDKYNWDSRKWINDNPNLFTQRTWRNIALASHGIINKMKCDDIDKEEVFNTLRSIAYINVNKHPAEHTSNNRWEHFDKLYNEKNCKKVLLEQIKYCNPNIIIGGNILYLFNSDLELEKANIPKINFSRALREKDSQLFIDALHPSRKGTSYCDEIINVALEWLK